MMVLNQSKGVAVVGILWWYEVGLFMSYDLLTRPVYVYAATFNLIPLLDIYTTEYKIRGVMAS